MRGAIIALPVNLLVVLLGVTQIVAWDTLFYAIAVLGAPMREALGVGDITLFGAFSAGLLLWGVIAPAVGRDIDAHGGRRVLVVGSLLAALFGAQGYGGLLGRLARPQFFARAIAPVTLALVQSVDGSKRVAPYLRTVLGVAAFIAYRRALALASSGPAQQPA